MSKSFHVLAVCVLTALTHLASVGAARAQSSPVVFQGLTHTAVGDAILRLDSTRAALAVDGLGPDGTDGVAVKKEGALNWTARLSVPVAPGLPLRVSWSALADGRRIGSGLLRRSGENFDMSAVFTGATTKPTFSAQVYNNGKLVGAIGSLPPTTHILVPISFCRVFTDLCDFTSRFHTLDDGACMIVIQGAKAVPIRLPNGVVVTGNEVRMVEEVRGAGHYPYLAFDTLVMQSDASSFAILSETLR